MPVDIEKAATELVEVFHENKIPIALMRSVFARAVEKVEENTMPYDPKEKQVRR